MRLSLMLRSLRSRGPFLLVECALLAIGCTAALLSLSSARTALDTSLRCPHPERTYFIGLLDEKGPVPDGIDKGLPYDVPGSVLKEWIGKPQLFSRVGGFGAYPVSMISGVPTPAPVQHAWINEGMLAFLPQRIDAGRPLVESDFHEGTASLLVTHRFLKLTGLSLSSIGALVRFNGGTKSGQIVGVLPATSRFPYRVQPDILIPLQTVEESRFSILAEIQPGLKPSFVGRELTQELNRSSPDIANKRVALVPIKAGLDSSQVRVAQYGLAVGFLVLLLVLATGAFIELLDTTRRSKELSIKLALGASSSVLVFEKLIQVLAVCLAALSLSVFLLLESWPSISRIWSTEWASAPKIDLLTIAAIAGLLFLSCGLAALGPTLVVRAIQPFNALKEIQTSASPPIRRGRMAIVSVQIAACVGFTLTATKLRTELNTMATRPVGVSTANIWGGTILNENSKVVWDTPAYNTRLRQLQVDLSALPGIDAATFSSDLPSYKGEQHGGMMPGLARRGALTPPGQLGIMHYPVTQVGPNYLQVLNCRLVQGRYFTAQDFLLKSPPVILSEPLAHELFGDSIPAAPQVALGGGEKEVRDVVGVVSGMRTFGISQPLTREVFEPMTAPWSYTALVIRETKPGSISFRQIQEAISKALPGAQLIDFQSLQDRFETELKVPRKRLFLLGSFSSIAAMVAIFGLCSVLFAVIKERDMEIGIRLALGADSPAIARALLTSILPWIFLGGIAGVVLSLFVSDPFHFDARVPAWQMAAAQMQILLVLGALVAVSLWIPLRRAFQRPVSDLLRTL